MKKFLLISLIALAALSFLFAQLDTDSSIKLTSTISENSGVVIPEDATPIGFIDGTSTTDKKPLLYISFMDASEMNYIAIEDAPEAGITCDLTGEDAGYDRVKFVVRYAGNTQSSHDFVVTLSCADGFEYSGEATVESIPVSFSEFGDNLEEGIADYGISVNGNAFTLAAGKVLNAVPVAASYATWTQSSDHAAGDYEATITIACEAR